jgi:hypothetical protein
LTITGGLENQNMFGGGGILNLGGRLTLISSTVTRNAAFGGGGIATGPGPFGGSSVATLIKSRVDGNTAHGTPMMGGGGGVANGGTLHINKGEIADNQAVGSNAGGLLNHGDSAMLNKTKVTGNTADFDGGGIANVNFGLPSTPTVALRLNSSQVTGNSASSPLVPPATPAGGILNVSFGSGAAIVTLNPKTQVTGNSPSNCEPPGAVPRCTG